MGSDLLRTEPDWHGVNFEHMPELGWTLGYPLALLVMVLTSVVLYVVFKRIKWL